ncbi:hypothetical protein OSTOST_11320, partial [Ostertagia ostertagi]
VTELGVELESANATPVILEICVDNALSIFTKNPGQTSLWNEPNERCTNTPGSFECSCLDGYKRDGSECVLDIEAQKEAEAEEDDEDEDADEHRDTLKSDEDQDSLKSDENGYPLKSEL